jgi:hypothetical protein
LHVPMASSTTPTPPTRVASMHFGECTSASCGFIIFFSYMIVNMAAFYLRTIQLYFKVSRPNIVAKVNLVTDVKYS